MVELLRTLLPYLLLGIFLLKGFRRPIYFLGVSFLMYMSESIFFETVKIFQVPGRILPVLKMIWMIIFWLLPFIFQLYIGRGIRRSRQNAGILDYLILVLIITTIIGLAISLMTYPVSDGIIMEFFMLLSLFIGYFIIRDWSFSCKPEVLKGFLLSLVMVNTLSAVLYILHQGAGLGIYDIEEYIEEIFGGERITRSFWFMPQLLFFSIAYLLVFRADRPLIYTVMLIINLGAVFITYSRSTLIVSLFLIVFYFIILGFKENRIGYIIKNIVLYMVIAVIGLIAVIKIFPTNAQYFQDRFRELTEERSPYQINSLEYRIERTAGVVESIDAGKIIFGMGPVTEDQEPSVPVMKSITSDMVWTGVAYRWGIIGIVVFILLYVYAFLKSYRIFVKSTGLISHMGLMFMIILVSQILEGITSWTFLSGHGYATGLWYFAMVAVLENKVYRQIN
ncbi:MAG TPA: hypothetical protein PL069_08670 [Saprospiraceae bacterium]|jgi:hypothetical protein|nr:hypothetical protein [Bacteroidales bacterium]HQP77473.1 hypothetical protein [Saprospiraceae bacterium]